ncbi:MAG: biotin transporter BioY [Saprospiraceae bacterium]|nr:biotin transporter BioY [Saprospiraceae bacterium]
MQKSKKSAFSGKRILWVITGIIFLFLASQISIQPTVNGLEIPITGQTLAVILLAYFLPKYDGAVSLFGYLLLAALGVPILSEFSGGWEKFTGGSAGFLLGFFVATLLVSFLKDLSFSSVFFKGFLINLLGTLLILFLGNLWLIFNYGFSDGLSYGFFPFWPGAMIKVLFGTFAIYFWEGK